MASLSVESKSDFACRDWRIRRCSELLCNMYSGGCKVCSNPHCSCISHDVFSLQQMQTRHAAGLRLTCAGGGTACAGRSRHNGDDLSSWCTRRSWSSRRTCSSAGMTGHEQCLLHGRHEQYSTACRQVMSAMKSSDSIWNSAAGFCLVRLCQTNLKQSSMWFKVAERTRQHSMCAAYQGRWVGWQHK